MVWKDRWLVGNARYGVPYLGPVGQEVSLWERQRKGDGGLIHLNKH